MEWLSALTHVSLVWISINCGTEGSYADVLGLKQEIFRNYDRHIRPVKNQSRAVNMNMTFTISSIDTLDLKSQKLKWNGFLSLKWFDENLAWNSSNYGNTDFITVPQSQIWLPDIVITNDVTSSTSLGHSETLVFLKSSGHMTWEPNIVTETSCKIDIRKYPFDEQSCDFQFLPWMTTVTGLNTTASSNNIDTSTLLPHGEFIVGSSSVKYVSAPIVFQDEDLLGVTYTIVLTRRPTFYWMIMIFPMMTFPLLCPISFLVPVECGEKITLSITVVLSFLVFISSMNDAMPKLSDTVSLLVVYSSVQTTISMLTVVANGIIICISKLPPDYEIRRSKVAATKQSVKGRKSQSLQTLFQSLSDIKMAFEEPKKGDMHKEKQLQQPGGEKRDKWILVARKLDRYCFFFFLSFTIFVSVVFIFLIFL